MVLNDIGPVIEREGLARIVAYVGRVPLPATWKEATDLVMEMNRRQFPSVTSQQWAEFARQVFNDDNGLPAPSYDPNLSKAISLLGGECPTFGRSSRRSTMRRCWSSAARTPTS